MRERIAEAIAHEVLFCKKEKFFADINAVFVFILAIGVLFETSISSRDADPERSLLYFEDKIYEKWLPISLIASMTSTKTLDCLLV